MRLLRILAFSMLLALTLSAVANAGPPLPNNCSFNQGAMTCVVDGDRYLTHIVIGMGDTYCIGNSREVVTAGSLIIGEGFDRVVTQYYGVSHVVKSQETYLVAWFTFGEWLSQVVGSC